jgi:hypothetical protein
VSEGSPERDDGNLKWRRTTLNGGNSNQRGRMSGKGSGSCTRSPRSCAWGQKGRGGTDGDAIFAGALGTGDGEEDRGDVWEASPLDSSRQKVRIDEAQLEVASKHQGTAGGGGTPVNCLEVGSVVGRGKEKERRERRREGREERV